jgi:hypothetical protein
MGYKSKCKSFQCCGLKIERNTELEEKYDEKELELQRNNNKEENKI